MAVSELNEDTQDQICDLLENLQQIEKLKNNTPRDLNASSTNKPVTFD